MQTLNDFVIEQCQKIMAFQSWWIKQNKIDSERFPMKMEDENEGLWWEMFQEFDETEYINQTDIITTEGKAVDDDETHWTVECPVCEREFEFTGGFDPDELVDCDKCKAKIKVTRIYFSNGDYTGNIKHNTDSAMDCAIASEPVLERDWSDDDADLITEIDNTGGRVITNVPLDKKMREELGF